MNKRMQILALLGIWSMAALSPAARADGSLNTTHPDRPQQPVPTASSNYVYGAGTVYTPGPSRQPADTYRNERRQYGAGSAHYRRNPPPVSYGGRRDYHARDRAVIEYSRDGGRDGYLIYRRNLDRRGDGYRHGDRRRHEERRDYGGRRYESRDVYREGRDRDSRHGRDKDNCLGSHCYEQSVSRDGKREKDSRRE